MNPTPRKILTIGFLCPNSQVTLKLSLCFAYWDIKMIGIISISNKEKLLESKRKTNESLKLVFAKKAMKSYLDSLVKTEHVCYVYQ